MIGSAYQVLSELAPDWWEGWFHQGSVVSPQGNAEPFSDASVGARMDLFRLYPREAWLAAREALYSRAGRTLEGVSLMYGLADYFEDHLPGDDEPRGTRWRRELSESIAEMTAAATKHGASADLEPWVMSANLFGAMFFPEARAPRAWRTAARRRLRSAGMTSAEIAMVEVGWLRLVDFPRVDESNAKYPAVFKLTDASDAISNCEAELKAIERKAADTYAQGRAASPRLLIREVTPSGIFTFGAVDRAELERVRAAAEAAGHALTFAEPLSPIPG